jgi:hypothetical protein
MASGGTDTLTQNRGKSRKSDPFLAHKRPGSGVKLSDNHCFRSGCVDTKLRVELTCQYHSLA